MVESPVMQIGRTLLGRRDDWRLRRPPVPQRPRPGLAWIGPSLMVGATAVGWFAFEDAVGEEGNVAFALFIGSVSILLMAWSNVLAMRLRPMEPLFGGLDRMYRWHRWFGALSVAAMWLHVEMVDEVRGIPGASKGVADAAEDLAGTGETLLYVLVAASLIRWVPYRWWKVTHKFMIVPYVLAAWHFHTATKPYANSDPWGRWFQVLMILGVAAWVHRVLWRDGIRRGRRHEITSIERSGTTATVELTPTGRPLKHRTGQFAFLRMGTRPHSEPHPFTIASHPDEPVLRFHIKDLGDWSGTFHGHIATGEMVRVEGPYGGLKLFPRRDRRVLWIAGGVGITPFLGAATETRPGRTVPHLFYAVRSRGEAPGLDELTAAHAAGRIVLHLHVSGEGTRLGDDDIVHWAGPGGLDDTHVVMCGPDALVRQMSALVRSLGARHVHVEGFDIRSGVGPDLSHEVNALARTVGERVGATRLRRADVGRPVQDSDDPVPERAETTSVATDRNAVRAD